MKLIRSKPSSIGSTTQNESLARKARGWAKAEKLILDKAIMLRSLRKTRPTLSSHRAKEEAEEERGGEGGGYWL